MNTAAALAPWIFYIILFIVGYVKLQNQVKVNEKTLTHHQKLLTSGNGGGAPFITEPEHDKLQASCQERIQEKIDSIVLTMEKMEETMKRGDQCRTEAREETSNQLSATRKETNRSLAGIREDMGNFQKSLYSLINPLVTQVAVHAVEIKHINENKKDKKNE